jgi:hypothetical protein
VVDDSDITGGYLLELSDRLRVDGPFFTTPVQGLRAVYDDPTLEDLPYVRHTWIRNYVGQFERALYGPGNYRDYLDVDAAVDFVLLNELFRNFDTFKDSTYMYKGVGEKLVLGPLWDFDHALGNNVVPEVPDYQEANTADGWQYLTRPGYRWVERLYADPGFRRQMATRWRELVRRGLIPFVVRTIDRGARQVMGGPEVRNFTRWPLFATGEVEPDDPRTGAPPESYPQAVDYLRWWVVQRADWITRNIGAFGGNGRKRGHRRSPAHRSGHRL